MIAAPSVNATSAAITSEILESKIKETEASTELEVTIKARLIELYRKSLAELEKHRSYEHATKVFEEAMNSAPQQTQKIRVKLKQPLPTLSRQSLKVSEKSALTLLEQNLIKEQADLSALESKLADFEKQLDEQINRPTAARTQLTVAKQAQEANSNELKQPSPPNEPKQLLEARRWLLQTRQQTLSAEIKMLDQELLSQAVRVELLQAQRDEAAREVTIVKSRVELLGELVNQRRLSEAAQTQAAAEEAERKAIGKHPLIQQVAENNAGLTENLTVLATEIDNVTDKVELMNQKVKQIESDFRSDKQKLEIAGLNKALGRILLDQRRRLPSVRVINKDISAREEVIAEAGLQQVKYVDERRRLRNIDSVVVEMTSVLSEQERKESETELRKTLTNRLELLDKAITINGAYLRILAELDFAQRTLLKAVQEYDQFLTERLLWMPSVTALDLSTIKTLPDELSEFFSPKNWGDVVTTLGKQSIHQPVLIPSIILFVILLWGSRRLRIMLQDVGKKVGRSSSDRFMYSVKAMAITILLAISWPLLFIAIGTELQASAYGNEFTKAVGYAIFTIVPTYLFLRVFVILCSPDGVGRKHFNWSQANVLRIRREVNWLMLILLPSAFVAVLSGEPVFGASGYSLSRLAFIIMMSSLAVFFARLLHLKRGVLRSYLARHTHSWLVRLRYIWYPAIIAIPLALMVLGIVGYLYTASVLTESLINTLWLVLGLIIVHELVVRWLLLTRKQLMIQTMKKRAKSVSKKDSHLQDSLSENLKQVEAQLHDLDLAAIDSQTRKLLNTAIVLTAIIGSWLIWSDVLPAFGILNDISLWQHTAVVDGEEKLVPITLASIALAIIFVTITMAAARNLPSVLEIVLLQQLSLDSGSRYAIATLVRYTIAGTGIVLVFNTLGGSWSQIQWLIAALGVGIGFGLQEIVANFISGVIILFERPIRVGDLVSVGDTTGVVTRIRIRATTIRNWDKQELVVPNKEFITTRLLNWSLSDQINRIVIPVGVAYDSDIPKALKLLTEVATEHQHVLTDPAPIATFESFGDNALTLKLRCYLDKLEYRLETTSELHEKINEKFSSENIIIAFPQRDLHLDTSRPLDIKLHQVPAEQVSAEKNEEVKT